MTPSERLSRVLAHKRVVIVVIVLAFVGVFALVGAVSRNSPTTPTTAAAVDPATGPGMVPYASWYWTMAVGRSSPDVLVLGTSSGLYRTTNGGASWQAVGPTHVNATSLVDAGSTIYMGGAQIASIDTSPVIRSGSGRTVSDGAAVLASSSDDGATWHVLHPSGLPSVAIQALAVDPSHGSTLYALLNTGALYRSTNGGTSFQLVSPRLGISPWALAITENSQFVGGDMDSGSHVSATGKAWQVIPFTDASGGRMVMEYAVQPAHATRIVMTSIGVVISTDAGKTWHVALKSPTMFGPVAFSPSNPELAFAVDFSQHLWRSTNGGTSWSEVK